MPEKPFDAYDGDEPLLFVSYAHDDVDLVYPEMADQGCWFIDPIDGTDNDTHNRPQSGAHVALRHRDDIVLGVISRPGASRSRSADRRPAWRAPARLAQHIDHGGLGLDCR